MTTKLPQEHKLCKVLQLNNSSNDMHYLVRVSLFYITSTDRYILSVTYIGFECIQSYFQECGRVCLWCTLVWPWCAHMCLWCAYVRLWCEHVCLYCAHMCLWCTLVSVVWTWVRSTWSCLISLIQSLSLSLSLCLSLSLSTNTSWDAHYMYVCVVCVSVCMYI